MQFIEKLTTTDPHDPDPFAHFDVRSTGEYTLPAAPAPHGESVEAYLLALDEMRGNDVAPSSRKQDDDWRDASAEERFSFAMLLKDGGWGEISLDSAPTYTDSPDSEDAAASFEAGVFDTFSGNPRHERDLDTLEQRQRLTQHDALDAAAERLGSLWNESAAMSARSIAAQATHDVALGMSADEFVRDVQRELRPAEEQGSVVFTRDEWDVVHAQLRGAGAGVAAVLLDDPFADVLTLVKACEVLTTAKPPKTWAANAHSRGRVEPPLDTRQESPRQVQANLCHSSFARRCELSRKRVQAAFPVEPDRAYLAWHDAHSRLTDYVQSREDRGLELVGIRRIEPGVNVKKGKERDGAQQQLERQLLAQGITWLPVFSRPERDVQVTPAWQGEATQLRLPTTLSTILRCEALLAPRVEQLPVAGPAPRRTVDPKRKTPLELLSIDAWKRPTGGTPEKRHLAFIPGPGDTFVLGLTY